MHPIHSIFGYKLVFSGSVEGTIDAICGSIKSKMAATAITPQPVFRHLLFGLILGFSGLINLTVQLSVTFSDP